MKNAFFNDKEYNIPADKFKLANENVKLSDQKFVDKPIGYFHDAWIRFRKNKSSVVAMIIIILIMIFSLVAPLCVTTHDSAFCDVYYSKKGPRMESLYKMGFDGIHNNF